MEHVPPPPSRGRSAFDRQPSAPILSTDPPLVKYVGDFLLLGAHGWTIARWQPSPRYPAPNVRLGLFGPSTVAPDSADEASSPPGYHRSRAANRADRVRQATARSGRPRPGATAPRAPRPSPFAEASAATRALAPPRTARGRG